MELSRCRPMVTGRSVPRGQTRGSPCPVSIVSSDFITLSGHKAISKKATSLPILRLTTRECHVKNGRRRKVAERPCSQAVQKVQQVIQFLAGEGGLEMMVA